MVVGIDPVESAAAVGKPSGTVGFPTCTATVNYPLHGYRSLFGWVQFVRSDDNSSGGTTFELDPFILFEDTPSPYAFYGILPTLFDAPSRDDREPLVWLAHSFLASTPVFESERRVVPLLGFSWGFNIDHAGSISFAALHELSADAWESHLPYLRARFPGWRFDRWG